MTCRILKLLVIIPVLFTLACDQGQKDTFITIGTGGVTGIYYPAGAAICRMVNQGRRYHGLRCSVEATGASIYNLRALRRGDLDIGVAQSDWQYHAVKGSSVFEMDGPDDHLRTIFSLHSEPFTVIARKDSGILTFKDLKGKRVNIGNPGSGSRATIMALMKRLNWTRRDFAIAAELKAAEQSQALCDNKLDAIIYIVGHPSGAVKEALSSCQSILVDVEGAEIDQLVQSIPYYSHATIPSTLYQSVDRDIKTFGTRAVFVTSSEVDEDIIYQLVQATVGNLDQFRRLHPAFQLLNVEEMTTESLAAPLHPGAVKYYRQYNQKKQSTHQTTEDR